jgi:hypothetical protein
MAELEAELNDDFYQLEGEAEILEDSLRQFNEQLEKYL